MAHVEIESDEFLRWVSQPWAETKQNPWDWFYANSSRFLFSREHVLSSAVAYEPGDGPNCGGIYFLIQRNEIVYVGISCEICARLVQHWRAGRDFDRYWCIGGLTEGFAQFVETFYIHVFRPVSNEKYPHVNRLIQPLVAAALRQSRESKG
jgi:hypothetical protein